ncbi:phytolongin Phyl2.2-like [Rutidosis leptorrhynchoides]|uniref:phytolongin Phyl2.2-like n=1 Tax=Rutidosis leptorrhynchoides TaxID=125765 RepID=UPI003A99329B
MNWNPNSILYTCIAIDTTILAEFNSKHADDLTNLATKCLHKTPPFHSTFSHTVNGKTYMFYIQNPFVYFGIFDELLEKPECLSFLKTVKDAFTSTIDHRNHDTLSFHFFQDEFSPMFQRILGFDSEVDMMSSLNDYHVGNSESLRRKKRIGLEDEKSDVYSDDDASVSSGCRVQKGMYIWKKQVMVVLSVDLVVCVALFIIWLWVCNGFECVAS